MGEDYLETVRARGEPVPPLIPTVTRSSLPIGAQLTGSTSRRNEVNVWLYALGTGREHQKRPELPIFSHS